VLEPILNPRLGLLIMIGLVGAGAAAVLMKSFAQDSIAAPALLADEIGLLVGTDPSRRLKPSGSPELQRIAEAVNSLADQRRACRTTWSRASARRACRSRRSATGWRR
jgi:DNA polymerase-3 subunit epsilon